MAGLDLDDPRPPYQQVANSLRASIRTGVYPPGKRLPSQTELAKEFGVARMTVQQALRELKKDQLVVSRQGSGVFVRERTSTLGSPAEPFVAACFQSRDVAIDYVGSLTVNFLTAMHESVDRVRRGLLNPESVRIRMLITSHLDQTSGRTRQDAAVSQAQDLGRTLSDLRKLGLIRTCNVQTRLQSLDPQFTMYVLNDADVLFGFEVAEQDMPPAAHDPMLTHHTATGVADSANFVTQAGKWFAEAWKRAQT